MGTIMPATIRPNSASLKRKRMRAKAKAAMAEISMIRTTEIATTITEFLK